MSTAVEPIPGNGPEPVVPATSTGPAPQTSAEPTFTAAQLEAARKQEKDKLYDQIQNLQAESRKTAEALAAIQKQKDDEVAQLAAKQAEKDAAVQAKKEEDMSAKALLEQKLRETNDTWESRFNQLQTERDTEKALLEKEREYNELVSYRNSAIENAKDEVAPQFYDFIQGTTKEQIDAGIERAKSATESLADTFKQAQAAQLSQMRGVSTAGYTAAGPMEQNPGVQQLTPEQIAAMPMDQYRELRNKTGIGAAEQRSNRGIFG